MISYYGYKISPNQLETGEGFLICRNVPIARAGTMDYLASELGLDGHGTVPVSRTADEVFSDAALASFEGKPATDGHPPELLTPDTFALYAKGHVQNVRKGAGEWDGYVIADLHIQDEGLIREIQNGKREVSCGYECDFAENEDGTYSQQNIRGNHVAIVAEGRAGKRAAILDSRPQDRKPERKGRNMKKQNPILSLFARAVKDATPEEAETLAADAAEALEGAAGKDVKTEADDNAPGTVGLDERMGRILDGLEKLIAAQEGTAKEEEGSPLDQAIASLEAAGKDGAAESEESVVVPATEMDGGKAAPATDRAALLSVLKGMRPAIAAIKDDAERKRVTDSVLSCFNSAQSDIGKIVEASHKNARMAADCGTGIDLEACQCAYDRHNPHKKGDMK